jgi:hypothetical protein
MSHRAGQSHPLSNAYFKSLGLPSLVEEARATTRTAVYASVRTVVWQGSAGNRCPYAGQPRLCFPMIRRQV